MTKLKQSTRAQSQNVAEKVSQRNHLFLHFLLPCVCVCTTTLTHVLQYLLPNIAEDRATAAAGGRVASVEAIDEKYLPRTVTVAVTVSVLVAVTGAVTGAANDPLPQLMTHHSRSANRGKLGWCEDETSSPYDHVGNPQKGVP